MEHTGHVTYMQQRYYDPGIGMFLSVDPVTAYSDPIGQFHRYRYANNNPFKFTDPDGRRSALGCGGSLCDRYREISRQCARTCVAEGADQQKTRKPQQSAVESELRMLGNFVRDEGADVLFRTATTIGGFGQVGLGAALCATAAGCAAGGPIGVLGASNIQEGFTGQPGFMRQAATATLGPDVGNLVVDGANLTSAGAGLLRPVLKPGAWKLFRNTSDDFVPAYQTATRTGLTAEVGASAVSAVDTVDSYYEDE